MPTSLRMGRPRDALERVGQLEETVSTKTSRVNDSFGYSFVVKVLNLLQKNVVSEERRATLPAFSEFSSSAMTAPV